MAPGCSIRFLEKREVYFPVSPFLDATWVVFEMVVCRMFQDKNPIGDKACRVQDQIGNPGDVFKLVGRVGKNQIIRIAGLLKEREGILPEHMQIGYLQFLDHAPDEIRTSWMDVHGVHVFGSPRNELVGNAADAGKQIQDFLFFPFQMVSQDVEKAFLGRVGSRPDGQVPRRLEPSSFELAADDSHGGEVTGDKLVKGR